MPTLLFLCTGNYYRSRFAEHLFNALAVPRDLPWSADSRGLAIELGADNVGPIAQETLEGLAARGVAVGPPIRMPAQANDDDFSRAGRVIALCEREHQPLVIQRFPAWAHHVEYWDVPDVGDLPVAEACDRIEQQVAALVRELQASQGS
jgi:protein-tyrosine phosphatase